MKMSRFILVGIIFGITLYKAEAVSWYRIFEMFHFQSFHMYGIIFSAVAAGVIIVQLIKKGRIKASDGNPIQINKKDLSIPRYLIGGFIFGLGWGSSGCLSRSDLFSWEAELPYSLSFSLLQCLALFYTEYFEIDSHIN